MGPKKTQAVEDLDKIKKLGPLTFNRKRLPTAGGWGWGWGAEGKLRGTAGGCIP